MPFHGLAECIQDKFSLGFYIYELTHRAGGTAGEVPLHEVLSHGFAECMQDSLFEQSPFVPEADDSEGAPPAGGSPPTWLAARAAPRPTLQAAQTAPCWCCSCCWARSRGRRRTLRTFSLASTSRTAPRVRRARQAPKRHYHRYLAMSDVNISSLSVRFRR